MSGIAPETELVIEAKLKKTRHDIDNKFQSNWFEISDKIDGVKDRMSTYETQQELSLQLHKTMQKDIDKIGQQLDKIVIKLESLDKVYATKEEHKQNQESIKKINSYFLRLIYLVFGAIIGALVNLVMK